jgi:hypothetical protein
LRGETSWLYGQHILAIKLEDFPDWWPYVLAIKPGVLPAQWPVHTGHWAWWPVCTGHQAGTYWPLSRETCLLDGQCVPAIRWAIKVCKPSRFSWIMSTARLTEPWNIGSIRGYQKYQIHS